VAQIAALFGLSNQVPMKLAFLTDGPNQVVQVGRQVIELRRMTPRTMATGERMSGLVVQPCVHLEQLEPAIRSLTCCAGI
jgi:Family of unknown function (DUF6088)